MSYPVTYYCPHCGVLAELQREGYLADKTVTPYPFEGWEYAAPDEAFEEADGVAFVCGESEAPGLTWLSDRRIDPDAPDASAGSKRGDGADDGTVGCGERFYLSFVRHEGGEEVDPPRPSEFVEIDPGTGPTGPARPPGPDGPDSPR